MAKSKNCSARARSNRGTASKHLEQKYARNLKFVRKHNAEASRQHKKPTDTDDQPPQQKKLKQNDDKTSTGNAETKANELRSSRKQSANSAKRRVIKKTISMSQLVTQNKVFDLDTHRAESENEILQINFQNNRQHSTVPSKNKLRKSKAIVGEMKTKESNGEVKAARQLSLHQLRNSEVRSVEILSEHDSKDKVNFTDGSDSQVRLQSKRLEAKRDEPIGKRKIDDEASGFHARLSEPRAAKSPLSDTSKSQESDSSKQRTTQPVVEQRTSDNNFVKSSEHQPPTITVNLEIDKPDASLPFVKSQLEANRSRQSSKKSSRKKAIKRVSGENSSENSVPKSTEHEAVISSPDDQATQSVEPETNRVIENGNYNQPVNSCVRAEPILELASSEPLPIDYALNTTQTSELAENDKRNGRDALPEETTALVSTLPDIDTDEAAAESLALTDCDCNKRVKSAKTWANHKGPTLSDQEELADDTRKNHSEKQSLLKQHSPVAEETDSTVSMETAGSLHRSSAHEKAEESLQNSGDGISILTPLLMQLLHPGEISITALSEAQSTDALEVFTGIFETADAPMPVDTEGKTPASRELLIEDTDRKLAEKIVEQTTSNRGKKCKIYRRNRLSGRKVYAFCGIDAQRVSLSVVPVMPKRVVNERATVHETYWVHLSAIAVPENCDSDLYTLEQREIAKNIEKSPNLEPSETPETLFEEEVHIAGRSGKLHSSRSTIWSKTSEHQAGHDGVSGGSKTPPSTREGISAVLPIQALDVEDVLLRTLNKAAFASRKAALRQLADLADRVSISIACGTEARLAKTYSPFPEFGYDESARKSAGMSRTECLVDWRLVPIMTFISGESYEEADRLVVYHLSVACIERVRFRELSVSFSEPEVLRAVPILVEQVCNRAIETKPVLLGDGKGATERVGDKRSASDKSFEAAVKRDLFDAVDVGGYGEICLEALRIVLTSKGYNDSFVEHIFCHLDINKDGIITRQEFEDAVKFIPIEIFTEEKAISNSQLLRFFDEFDVDKSGSVDLRELGTALRDRGIQEDVIRSYFKHLDINGDYEISREEYARCIGVELDIS